ncbi:MAG: 4'-phosphopantetheinyl transferase superfamily protein [Flavobacteriales bacterium]|jgi:4'-phosphopantetheinyl transferase|nr:4'-phosphopantetheinyl transferase superfamily protein [Flavobacteriales bacterium]MBK6551388.1 4'-phosphopantetheinyl transferase superfamily protein [Flavobacteriales bacterium]MBK6882787.1 4'-phosphopantetheinyl transferase superfamily protein [Flavobacteriales bacterium]MBK7101780.1 4'-phosphopantetheinyl transferase superfamily protein [Flavobacteriales bacterium]MBK7114129.1 4'-phosphopantetheinyl transferase superfamily protein [Flavobacteriales bacterium]
MNEGTGRSLIVHCDGPLEARFEPNVSIEQTGITIHFATLEALRPYADQYATLLDQGENERLERFRFPADRERFLLGHGALRVVLSQRSHSDAAALRFDRGTYGKPVVAGSRIHFNLSDTKDAIAIAVGGTHELGVDLETTDRKVDHVAVGEHYFTIEERASISDSNDGKRRFLEFWTRKEAVLKASGVGIMDDLRVLRVDLPANRMTITHDAFKSMAAETYHVKTWTIGDPHIVSLATVLDPGPVRFERIRH